jgi:hypothetical protein
VNRHLDFLLCRLYDHSPLDSQHAADLAKSGITDETRLQHKIRTVPPEMLRPLLGYDPRGVRTALLFPFPDFDGGFMDYVKVKVFGETGAAELRGDAIHEHRDRWRYNCGHRKYLVRRQAAPRLYIPIPTMHRAVATDEPLWLVEGMKKSLAVMQLGLPAIGLESPFSWHVKGSRALLDDFSHIRLRGRLIELVPDADIATNPMILRAMHQLGDALRAAGARPRLVRLPTGVKGADDFIVMKSGGDRVNERVGC